MKYDGILNLAVGLSARSKVWKNQKWRWSSFVAKIKEGHQTSETIKEYHSASKAEQSKIKDVGGYVGGYLRGGRRKPENVISRQLLTLDIDFAYKDLFEDFCLQYDNAAVLHSTHAHTPEKPRYRLLVPLSREVSTDEYPAVARALAGTIGIDYFDSTTFEINRLMFWPSHARDAEYVCEVQDGPWLDPDKMLATYTDWRDSSEWPVAGTELDKIQERVKKQQDPREKPGIIGAFCREYDIHQVIEKYLSDVYEPTDIPERYTYKKGSTHAGLVIYDNGLFAYSHHGTDPVSGRECNAFDLVRIHKFGDDDPKKSLQDMQDFATKDPAVRQRVVRERAESARNDFKTTGVEDSDKNWQQRLEVNRRGVPEPTAGNIDLIFRHDENLAGKFKLNIFDKRAYVFDDLPWRKLPKKPDVVKDVDYSGLQNYIERHYGITARSKVEDSFKLQLEQNSFHPVRDYLNSLEWDGTPRIDTILQEYFGVEDSIYTREAMRKTLVGAVARVFQPGVKFDLVLTLVGAQGTGKSTMVRLLGKEWFSDTLPSIQNKEGMEQIQGAWIIEMAELAGVRKADLESTKHFISKQFDEFRPAYGRVKEVYPRECIFIGTTNDHNFLRDTTGNRRFMPILIQPQQATKDIFSEFEPEIDQIWAEAVALYKNKEKLYLSKEANKIATMKQNEHRDIDARQGIVEDYLDLLLPENWDEMDIYERHAYITDPLAANKGVKERMQVCTMEIWRECFGNTSKNPTRRELYEINDILRSLKGWKPLQKRQRVPQYGIQRVYERTAEDLL